LVQRNYTNLSLAPLTSIRLAVGNMLKGEANTANGDLNTVLTTLDNLPDIGSARNAYQQISPNEAAALSTLAFAGANLQERILFERITNLRFGGGEIGDVGGLPGSFDFNGSRVGGVMLAHNCSNLAGLRTSEKRAEPAARGSRWGHYLDPALVLGAQQFSVNQTGFNFAVAGFNAGADYGVSDDLLMSLPRVIATPEPNSMAPAPMCRPTPGPSQPCGLPVQAFLRLRLPGLCLDPFNLERQLSFGDLNRTAKSSTIGNQFNAYEEKGYDLKLKRLVVTPAVSLAYSRP
jgi:hypothetical protein